MLFSRRRLLVGLSSLPFLSSTFVSASAHDASPIVHSLAASTKALYHDEAVATHLAEQLLERLRKGAFAQATGPDALADELNRQIAEISGDVHFMVMGSAMGHSIVPPTPPHSPTPAFSSSELEFLKGASFGIPKAQILPGNVGRLEVRHFYRPAEEVKAAVAAAMQKLSNTSALIVDLSNNPGGDPRAVAHLLSYFFERPSFVVNRFHWRNLPIEEFRTETELRGPNYGESRPLVVQVSAHSFSAAEEFAYDIQALKRGSVVGQVTGGGANHALPVDLPGGMQAYIPQARAENPITRSNWERTGVQPDHKVEALESARAAHEFALAAIASPLRPKSTAVTRAPT